MDLSKSGRLLSELRKAKGMTQKQVAEKLGIVPKTVSKWETGHGFPDVSTLSDLAELFGVSEKSLISGRLVQNAKEVGNVKKTKFYVCPDCGSIIQGTGECKIICCGKTVKKLESMQVDDEHSIKISEIEDDFFVEFDHEMRKEHFIKFVAYVGVDRVFMVRLYPEQDPAIRIPRMYGGKFYYCCNKHGLFEFKK